MDTEHARQFWQVAQTFPPEKETVYPTHAKAHGFDEQKGKSVLEYGCGGGSDTISLLRRGANVFFVDIVPGNVALTRKRVDEWRRAHGSATFPDCNPLGYVLEHSDVLPFREFHFDTISCHGVLHHIEETLMHKVIDEQFRVLKSGGELFAMLYTEILYAKVADRIEELHKARGWTRDRAFGHFTDGGNDKHWCIARAYTFDEGRKLFEQHGFEFVSSVEYNDRDFRTFRMRKP